jgi:MFS transporter, ACS family, glucarate transporter
LSFAASLQPQARRAIAIRWWILAFLTAFTIIAYLQRSALSVAADQMMPQLGISQTRIGWLETAFLASYTALQLPGGLVGEWLGARRMFTIIGVVAVGATLAVPLLPRIAAGNALFIALIAAQLTLGAMQAPLFGVLTGTLERWFPPRQWALTQGLTTCGTGLGGAAAPLIISSLMLIAGWQNALIATALPATLIIAIWWFYGRDAPHLHPQVCAEELAELVDAKRNDAPTPINWRRIAKLVMNSNLAGLTLSYTIMNMVYYLITFWSFLYLVQARHFTIAQSGFSAALPPLAGAAGAGIGGIVGSKLSTRFGPSQGLRIIPLIALPAAGALLVLAARASDPAIALTGLALAFGVLETTEACFWASAMEIGRADAAAAGAILNTGGNLGGIIITPIIAALSARGDWDMPFVLGTSCALASAALWLVIKPDQQESKEVLF